MVTIQQAPWHDLPAGSSAPKTQALLQGYTPAFPQIPRVVMSAGWLGHWAFFFGCRLPLPLFIRSSLSVFLVLTVPTLSCLKGATPPKELSRALPSHDTWGLLALQILPLIL